MKTKVDISDLRKGDIIVSTTDAGISGVIRAGIGADFSHSMLYKGSSIVIEAIADGVVERSWSDASKDATLAIALRRRNMSDSLRDDVVKKAESFKGLKYDAVGAAGAGINKPRGAALSAVLFGGLSIFPLGSTASIITNVAIINNASDSNKDKAFFCSELVARSYQLIGKPLHDGVEPTFMNPREVRMSSKLIYIGHLIG